MYVFEIGPAGPYLWAAQHSWTIFVIYVFSCPASYFPIVFNKLIYNWHDVKHICPAGIMYALITTMLYGDGALHNSIYRSRYKICAGSHMFLHLQVSISWAGSWDYGTYHKGDQRRLRRVCASAQSRQSLRCSHTRSMVEHDGSDQKIRHLTPLDGCACAFEEWGYGGRKVP